MSVNPKTMDRVAVLKKVLEINPSFRLGDQSPEEMTEHLLSTIRESRRPNRFSDQRFVAVFNGMLTDLDRALDEGLSATAREHRRLDEKREGLRAAARERVLQFLAASSPRGLPPEARRVLGEFDDVLAEIGVSKRGLDRLVRERGATLTQGVGQ